MLCLFACANEAQCWISPAHETERLVCHYLWTFVNEFGTIVVYGVLFLYLHRKLERLRRLNPDLDASKSINRATRCMVLYPLVFVIATLPLAVGRMCTASGKALPDKYFFGAGSLLASCGWLDAVLYTFTRRVLLKSGPGGGNSNAYGSSYLGGDRRNTWFSGGFLSGGNPFSSANQHEARASTGFSNRTWEIDGKSPMTARTRLASDEDEVELVERPHSDAISPVRASSTTRDRNSSIYASSERTWPLPPAASPTPDEVQLPIPRRTMVRIEEEPGNGRAPRKYWRMEPVQSRFE